MASLLYFGTSFSLRQNTISAKLHFFNNGQLHFEWFAILEKRFTDEVHICYIWGNDYPWTKYPSNLHPAPIPHAPSSHTKALTATSQTVRIHSSSLSNLHLQTKISLFLSSVMTKKVPLAQISLTKKLKLIMQSSAKKDKKRNSVTWCLFLDK